MDGRGERSQPTGSIRHLGCGRPRQYSGHETAVSVGPMRPEIFGCSGDRPRRLHNTGGFLNDLWKYSAGEWTWMGGSNLPNQLGTYGTQGTAAPGNIPELESKAVNWTDAAGNLWLFGGYGFGSSREAEISTTCGSIARVNGLGWVARTCMANPRRMGFRGQPPLAMFPERETVLLAGPTPPEISGFSVGTVSTRSGQATTSTTYGSIARANGHGWADRTWSTNRDHMGPWARPPQAAFPGRDRTSLVGPILWATPGPWRLRPRFDRAKRKPQRPVEV